MFASTLVAAAVGLLACGDDQDPDEAKALLEQVRADDYTSWARAPGFESRKPTNAPHADQVEIFVNDVVVEALSTDGLTAWPEGSVIVKDGYDDDGTHALVAIMEKRSDGWFWAEYDAESGESKYSGKPGICIDCHDAGDDDVRAFSLP